MMNNLKKEIASYKGNEDVQNTICQILNCESAEIDESGNVWVSNEILSDEMIEFVWNHPLMN